MRAAGQFAGMHDEEALASLHRAAEKPRYDRYLLEDEAARQSLVREAYGERGAFGRIAVVASIYVPDFVFVRPAINVAIAKAMLAGKRGDKWAGLIIRRDVMHVGSLMRSQARDLDSVHLGARFVQLAMFSPGGPPVQTDDRHGMTGMPPGMAGGGMPGMPPLGPAGPTRSAAGRTPETTGSAPGMKAPASGKKAVSPQRGSRSTKPDESRNRPARHVDDFYAYLRTITPPAPAGSEAYLRQTAELQGLPAWIENECEAGWQVNQALDKGHDFSMFEGEESYRLTIWWAVGLFAAANAFWMAALIVVANGLLRTRLIKGFLPFAAVVGVLVAAGAFLCHGRAFVSMSAIQPVYQCLCTRPNDSDFLRSLAYPGVTVPVSLAAPVLFVLLFAVVSVLHRVPISTGILRGLKGAGTPVACILFLTYAGLAIHTAQLEAHANRSLDKDMQHQGRYFAELAGMQWPGETALPRHRAGLGSFRDPKPAESDE